MYPWERVSTKLIIFAKVAIFPRYQSFVVLVRNGITKVFYISFRVVHFAAAIL